MPQYCSHFPSSFIPFGSSVLWHLNGSLFHGPDLKDFMSQCLNLDPSRLCSLAMQEEYNGLRWTFGDSAGGYSEYCIPQPAPVNIIPFKSRYFRPKHIGTIFALRSGNFSKSSFLSKNRLGRSITAIPISS